MSQFDSPKIFWGTYAAGALLLLGIEASSLSPENSIFRELAAWAWMISSIFFLGVAFWHSLLPFFDAEFRASRDRSWYLLAFFFPTLVVLFGINDVYYTLINTESTQQIGSALFLMHERSDFGIFNLAFLGGTYPARQYLLAALPSLFFGKGLITLRLGYAALYLIGCLSFLSGVWAYLRKQKFHHAVLLASFTGVLIFLANYPVLFARIFEQTIIPLSVTLLFLAGLLFFLTRPSPLHALWVMWALGLFPYSYSPALSAWIFAMALLAYLCLPIQPKRTIPFLVCLVYGMATLTTSLVMQFAHNIFVDKFQISEFPDLNWVDWFYRYFSGLHATVGLEESLIPAPLMLGILIFLYLSLLQKDFRFLALCVWAAGTVGVSLTLKGYCWRPPEFDIHRAMIILPPLSLAFTLYLASYWKQFTAKTSTAVLRTLIIGVIVLMVLNTFYLPFIRRAPRAFYPELMTDTEEATLLVIHNTAPNPKRIYLIPPFNTSLEDSLQYFSPDTEVVHNNPPPGEHLPNTYLISFISINPDDHAWDMFVRHLHPRPFLQIKPE